MGLKRPRGGRQLGPQGPKWEAPHFPNEGGRTGVGEGLPLPPLADARGGEPFPSSWSAPLDNPQV